MVSLRFALAAAAVLVCVSVDVSETSSLTFDVAAAKNRPVAKVIKLLKDMLEQLQKDQEEDEAIYDKMGCWCETNDKEKTKAIEAAESRIGNLQTSVEELTAASSRLNTEIKNGEQEVAKNQGSLDKATAIREKELAEFNAEEKDLLESISALKSAVTVLSKHHSGALLQIPRSHVLGVATTLQHELQVHNNLLVGVLTHSDRKVLGAFIQAPEDYFDSAPTFKQSYAPQSGEIFGILKQMKETFENNLSTSQKQELANGRAYEDLKAAKEAEISAGQEQVRTKTQELAETDENKAQSKEDIEDTRNSLDADQKFLAMLKEKCAMTDKEWEMRQKTRADEMGAVSKAVAVLSSDDAHDLFTKTFNPALIQTEFSSSSKTRASKVLSDAAKKLNSPRLATMAVQVRLDAFTRVKKAIDDMVVQLQKEKQDEIKHKDYCVGGFHDNQMATEEKTRSKQDLEASIEDLVAQIKELTDAVADLEKQNKEMQIQLKRAGEDREKQNKEFQTAVADQRATQGLLKKALQVLEGFYGKKAFIQKGPPPPPGFNEYKKNEASGGVMGMLQTIINDAKNMEAECIRAEEDAQKAYEDLTKETNNSINTNNKNIINKAETKAKAELDHTEAEENHANTLTELEQLSNENADLHQACDFVMKNFEIRQEARDQEVNALNQAKAILSGANFQ